MPHDVLRTLSRHLCSVVNGLRRRTTPPLDEAEALVGELRAREDLADTPELAALARAIEDLRATHTTLDVLAARPHESRSLEEVIAAAELLLEGRGWRPLTITVEPAAPNLPAPHVLDAALEAQRLAGILRSHAHPDGKTELRWTIESPYVVVDLRLESRESDGGGPRIQRRQLELEGATPKRSGVVPRATGLRILVVDDDRSLRRALGRFFTREGHTVELAADGSDGMHLASTLELDVVLCDIDMPETSGFTLLEELSRRVPELAERFVFMSARVDDPLVRQRLLESGRPFVGKPADEATLLATLTEVAVDAYLQQRS